MSLFCSCLTERFTAIDIGSASVRCMRTAWRQPSRSTQRPIGAMRPGSPANGVKSADRHDPGGLLVLRHQLVRRHEAALGMAPAQEGLAAGRAARARADDALVV